MTAGIALGHFGGQIDSQLTSTNGACSASGSGQATLALSATDMSIPGWRFGFDAGKTVLGTGLNDVTAFLGTQAGMSTRTQTQECTGGAGTSMSSQPATPLTNPKLFGIPGGVFRGEDTIESPVLEGSNVVERTETTLCRLIMEEANPATANCTSRLSATWRLQPL